MLKGANKGRNLFGPRPYQHIGISVPWAYQRDTLNFLNNPFLGESLLGKNESAGGFVGTCHDIYFKGAAQGNKVKGTKIYILSMCGASLWCIFLLSLFLCAEHNYSRQETLKSVRLFWMFPTTFIFMIGTFSLCNYSPQLPQCWVGSRNFHLGQPVRFYDIVSIPLLCTSCSIEGLFNINEMQYAMYTTFVVAIWMAHGRITQTLVLS